MLNEVIFFVSAEQSIENESWRSRSDHVNEICSKVIDLNDGTRHLVLPARACLFELFYVSLNERLGCNGSGVSGDFCCCSTEMLPRALSNKRMKKRKLTTGIGKPKKFFISKNKVNFKAKSFFFFALHISGTSLPVFDCLPFPVINF